MNGTAQEAEFIVRKHTSGLNQDSRLLCPISEPSKSEAERFVF